MRFKVYLLRREGRLLPWREVVNGPSYVGDLCTHEVERGKRRYTVATLRAGDPMADYRVPELYEPEFTGMATLAFRLRGFERLETRAGPVAVVQEWHCELP